LRIREGEPIFGVYMNSLKICDEAPQPHVDDIGLKPKSVEDVTSYPYPGGIRDEEKRLTKDNALRDMQSKVEQGENVPPMPTARGFIKKQVDNWENEGGAAL
jgi:hypothetical protein